MERWGPGECIRNFPTLFSRVSSGIFGREECDVKLIREQMWDLLESRHLLDARGLDGRHSVVQHLVEMVALLRPPPLEFLQRSSESANYWTAEGKLAHVDSSK